MLYGYEELELCTVRRAKWESVSIVKKIYQVGT
jgi:hypothetical protein